jgi:putative ABC transport system permease protein
MIVMAMLFASGGLYLSTRSAIDELVDRQFGADMFIEGRGPIEPEAEAKIRGVDGIDSVSALRFGSTQITVPRSSAERPRSGRPVVTDEEEEVFVVMIDPATYFAHSSFFWKDGSDAEARAALTKGGRLLVPVGLANSLDLERGSRVVVDTPAGDKPMRVAGVYRDGPGPPGITLGLPDGKRYLNAGKPMALIATLDEGARPAAVKSAIEDGIGAEFGLDVETVTETKAQARSQVTQYFRIVYAILLVAAIVGLLGLANTLAMSVLRRFREIGILRAIGVTRSQMWRMVMIESLTLGFVAFVLSIPLGLLLTGIIVRTISSGFGFELTTTYPWSWIPIVAAFGLFITVIAAIAPGRRASRLHVVSALQYE